MAAVARLAVARRVVVAVPRVVGVVLAARRAVVRLGAWAVPATARVVGGAPLRGRRVVGRVVGPLGVAGVGAPTPVVLAGLALWLVSEARAGVNRLPTWAGPVSARTVGPPGSGTVRAPTRVPGTLRVA